MPVALQCAGTQDFSQASGGRGRLKLHLPEPVSGRHVSLGEKQVAVVLREDMRYAAVVVHNGYGLAETLEPQVSLCGRIPCLGILPEAMKGTQKSPRRRKSADAGIQDNNDDEGRGSTDEEFD